MDTVSQLLEGFKVSEDSRKILPVNNTKVMISQGFGLKAKKKETAGLSKE